MFAISNKCLTSGNKCHASSIDLLEPFVLLGWIASRFEAIATRNRLMVVDGC